MDDFLREIAMLKHVGQHKHVIRLIACCTRSAPLIALLEHAPRGDLLTLLRAARGKRQDLNIKAESNVTGRPSEADTEYTNLSDSDPQLDDPKLSGIYVHTRSRPVPLRWLAPEAIFASQYSSASDVWAFAVLLWEIATLGGFPYSELSNQDLPPFLTTGGRLPKPARASPRLYQLMTECWSDEATVRPTFAQIVDKLTIQNQLYVDLDCVFPPVEENFADLSDIDVSTDGSVFK
ncbi:unnamed protein product, partial [Leptidea sinapis]